MIRSFSMPVATQAEHDEQQRIMALVSHLWVAMPPTLLGGNTVGHHLAVSTTDTFNNNPLLRQEFQSNADARHSPSLPMS